MSGTTAHAHRVAMPPQRVTTPWPGWAVYMATMAGKLGAYVVAYRNPDWRTYEETRNPDFAAWAAAEDVRRQCEDAERSGEADPTEDVTRYVRCCNCGSKLLDPIIYTEASR